MKGGKAVVGFPDSSSSKHFTIQVDDFVMDKFEVSVSRFRAFYEVCKGSAVFPCPEVIPAPGAGKNPNIRDVDSGWKPEEQFLEGIAYAYSGSPQYTWSKEPAGKEAYPVYPVGWAQAQAFCIWDGGYLPSAAEWRYAYVNGAKATAFPWGNGAPTADLAVFGQPESSGPNLVGSRPKGASAAGIHDLAGNVEEWVWDAIDLGDCDHCGGGQPMPLNQHVMIGDSYKTPGEYIDAWLGDQSGEEGGPGFRCVRPVPGGG